MSFRRCAAMPPILFLLLGSSPLEAQLPSIPELAADAREHRHLLDRPARVNVRDGQLSASLIDLQNRSGVSLVYSPSKLPRNHRVDCNCYESSVGAALTQMLVGTGLRYVVVPPHVLIEADTGPAVPQPRELPPSLFFATDVRSSLLGEAPPPSTPMPVDERRAAGRMDEVVRTGNITGRVVDAATQRPLSATNVVIEGTQRGTITREDGRFLLTGIAAGTHRVRASQIGYGAQTQEVTVADGQTATIEFALSPQAVQMEELVAIGYGTVRRRDLTGAVAVVTAEELETRAAPTLTLSNALQGRAAGVQVLSNSGMPGAGLRVRIRGTNSINANSEPLYVIDGLPAEQGTNSSDPKANPLMSIDPSDIESIQVLKDASATAIYGARGANGVVLITTRRGRPGENQVTLESSYGVQRISNRIEALNAQEFMRTTNLARANAGQPALFTEQQITSAQTFDYPGMMIRTAPQSSHSLSVRGGNEGLRYLLGGNYTMQEGVVIGADFERIGGRLNLDANVSDRFRLGTSLNVAHVDRNASAVDNASLGNSANGIQAAIQFAPFQAPRDENGNWVKSSPTTEPMSNPVADAHDLLDRNMTSRLVGSVFGELDIADGLRLRSTLGGNYQLDKIHFYAPRTIRAGGTAGSGWINSGENRQLNSLNNLTYQGTFGPGNVDLLGGFEVTTYYGEGYFASATDFPTDATSVFNLGSGAQPNAPSSSISEWALLSYIGRANYNLLDRYLLTVTGRYDGSSRFGANNKWAFFPSAALAWRLSEESFMQNQKLFSDLKLRLSYGVTGSQAISPYNSLSQLSTAWYAFGGAEIPAMAPGGSMPNPDLRWEQQRQVNAGIDAGFLADRVVLSVDAYQSRTDDLLFSVTVPRTTGFGSQLRNIGSVENRGLELSLSTVNLETSAFSWRSRFNIAGNRNKVLDLGAEQQILLTARSGNFLGTTHILRVGEPMGAIFGYQVDGLFQEGDACYFVNTTLCAPGELKVVDQDGDRQIGGGDRVILGHSEPKFFGGINNSVRYGPLSLEAFVNFVYDNKIINAGAAFGELAIMQTNERASVRNHWTPDNPNTSVPRPRSNRQRLLYSTLVEDGSYIRLQTLTLGYQVPARLVPGVHTARLFLTGQNLWLGSRYSGFDPDVNSMGGDARMGGIDIGAYPRARTWNAGVSVTF